jgi:hypothetical protein
VGTGEMPCAVLRTAVFALVARKARERALEKYLDTAVGSPHITCDLTTYRVNGNLL